MFLLDIYGIDGEWKSKDPVGEAECIIIKLQGFFEIFVGYSIWIRIYFTVNCVDHVAGHLLVFIILMLKIIKSPPSTSPPNILKCNNL